MIEAPAFVPELFLREIYWDMEDRKQMWNDWFSIGPLTVHGYGVCIAAGLLLALFLAEQRAKKKGMNDDIVFGIVLCAAVFGFLGAKIMYCIVEFKLFLKDPSILFSSSGFVVYGGITGGILAVLIYTKIKKVSFIDYLELCMPSVALAQAFGRLGCFCAGCCYGRETDSIIGITFHNSLYAPNNVKLVPTQLISSAGDLLNMVLLLIIAKHTKKRGTVTACYVIFYSIGRFFVEIFRNDVRGSVGALSTSQFYGIFSLLIGIGLFVWANCHKEKDSVVTEEVVSNEEV